MTGQFTSEGRVAERRKGWDQAGMLQQLGALGYASVMLARPNDDDD